MTLEQLKKQDKKYAQRIADYLLKRVEEDPYLKEKLETTNKTLKGCVAYVKSEAQKQAEDNMAWCSDEEVYGWCVHYFLEDSLNFEPKVTKKKSEKEDDDIDEEEEKPQTKTVETLFGTEEIVIEKKKAAPKVAKPKKEIKEKFEEQLTLFDL